MLADFKFLCLAFLLFLLLLGGGPAAKPDEPIGHSSNFILPATLPVRFVVMGDTRFHDPADTKTANPEVRRSMVAAAATEKPAFITISGDIVNSGDSEADWNIWDSETPLWRERGIPVYPALGNHDLKGGEHALSNYFSRFPQLQNNRYYSLRAGNCLMLVLDSSLDETTGIQGEWLHNQLHSLPAAVDFLFVVLHHPPYTNSSDAKELGGGHSARAGEQSLAKLLEARQPAMHQRIIVLTGHVHNYERYENGGVTYIVTGGGGAHPYMVPRKSTDLYQDTGINYHYLLVEAASGRVVITMNKLDVSNGKETWSKPDVITIESLGGGGTGQTDTKP